MHKGIKFNDAAQTPETGSIDGLSARLLDPLFRIAQHNMTLLKKAYKFMSVYKNKYEKRN
jgi:hypothetical protein